MSKSFHCFSVDLAKQYGVNEAIILQNLIFWTEKKQASCAPEEDGLFYIYNSIRAWGELFPYLSEKVIRGCLNRLEKQKIITSRNDLNRSRIDKTKHYALTKAALNLISTKGQMDIDQKANGVPQRANALAQKDKPFTPKGDTIPDSKQQIVNSDSKQQIVNSDNLPAAKAASSTFAVDAIQILNSILGKNYRAETKETAKNLKALEKEKVTLEQIRQVINYKKLDWGADMKMREFLRPSTLLRPSNFFNYLEASENQPLNYQKTGVETLEDFDRKNQARVERIKQMTPTTSIGKTLLGEDFFND